MEISNRTLGLLLIAAIVVSLGGTMVSLNRLGDVSTTGYATNNQTGTVTLTVGSSLSVVVSGDNSIDFGSCAPGATMLFLDSQQNEVTGDNTECTGGTFPDNLTIQNDGNIDANITVRSSHNGTTFFDTAGGIAYLIANATSRPGCEGTEKQLTYLNFTVTNVTNPLFEYPGCSNLTFDDSNDQFQFFIQIALPPSTSVVNSPATIQFEAHPSTG